MKKIVLDCSVIIKWFFIENEQRVIQAKKLRDACIAGKLDILVPELLLLEIINTSILGKKADYFAIKNIIDYLFKIGLLIIPCTKDLLLKTAYYADKYKISAYDGSYVALAKTHGVLLVTDDQKLVKKVNLSFVKTLKEV